MGLLDRWLKRFMKEETPSPKASAGPSAAGLSATERDPTDRLMAQARNRMTTDEKGRAFVEGEGLAGILARLDEAGRSRAADGLLADALLVSASPNLRRLLADRLSYRGDRPGARRLYEELAQSPGSMKEALTHLGSLAEEEGNENAALTYYERALAVDITQTLAKSRARRLRARRDDREKERQKQRSLLARLLGAKAAGSRYAITEEIGRGGAAAVFRANDRVLKREVALKIFHPRGRPEERRARILAEAQVATSFDHPHIVPVFDVDVERDLLVMGLCEGGTLRARLDKGRLSALEAAEMGATLLLTLADVHQGGHQHLDVKPSNILFHQSRVLLGDFGAAGLAHRGAAAATRAYMSPEQQNGLALGPPSDLFSLGLVLMECLTGRLPGENESHLSLPELGEGPQRRAWEEVLGGWLLPEAEKRPQNLAQEADVLLLAGSLPSEEARGQDLWEKLDEKAAQSGRQARARLAAHAVSRWLKSPPARSPLAGR